MCRPSCAEDDKNWNALRDSWDIGSLSLQVSERVFEFLPAAVSMGLLYQHR
ncbi:hypothetical protein [Thiolapillus sp.]|uniref:hypothetical protein n=1 Tax=Thiolapillus sp. TaxID=2017437 RepID=UPI003AF76CC0